MASVGARVWVRAAHAIQESIPESLRQGIIDMIRRQLDIVVHKIPEEAYAHDRPFDLYVVLVGAVQNKNGTSWVPGNVYISHTVDYKGTPVPPPRQAFKHLYWVDGLETHRPRGVEDGTFYFYLKVDDAAEALPEIAYSGMKEEARAIIDVTYALLPPQLLSYDVVWGKELGAARRLSGWPEVKQFMSLASH